VFELRQTPTYEKWRAALKDERARAAIARRLVRTQSGNFGDAKYVGEGVSELRVDVGPGYRIYYHRRGDVVIVLLCGGDKRTQAADIAKARAMVTELEI